MFAIVFSQKYGLCSDVGLDVNTCSAQMCMYVHMYAHVCKIFRANVCNQSLITVIMFLEKRYFRADSVSGFVGDLVISFMCSSPLYNCMKYL